MMPVQAYDAVSPRFSRAIHDGFAQFSRPWLQLLAREGYECRLATSLPKALPERQGQLPRAQAEGVTYDHLQGLHVDEPSLKRRWVAVAEWYRPLPSLSLTTLLGLLSPRHFGWKQTESPVTVLHHELGHAAAHMAWVPTHPTCQKALADDRKRLPAELQHHPVLQVETEVMGCITASLLGQGGLLRISSERLLAAWPTLTPAIDRLLKAYVEA